MASVTRPPALTITLMVLGKVANPLNGSLSRAHWHVKSEWVHHWRVATKLAWIIAGQPTWDGPAAVTFTAYVGRLFDDDNLPGCIKPIRDEGVRLILGTDDGPTCGHSFTYAQEVRPAQERGVLITITPVTPLAAGRQP